MNRTSHHRATHGQLALRMLSNEDVADMCSGRGTNHRKKTGVLEEGEKREGREGKREEERGRDRAVVNVELPK